MKKKTNHQVFFRNNYQIGQADIIKSSSDKVVKIIYFDDVTSVIVAWLLQGAIHRAV